MGSMEVHYYTRIVTASRDWAKALRELSAAPVLVVDTETTGLSVYKGARVFGVSVYDPATLTAYYFLTKSSPSNYAKLLQLLGTKNLVMFNAKFDLHMLVWDGMPIPPLVEDVLVAAHLLNENERLSNGGVKGAFSLKRLAGKYLGQWAQEGEEELTVIAKQLHLDAKKDMAQLPVDIVAKYAMLDVVITWHLREFYIPGLERWNNIELYYQRCAFQLKALFRMERNGILVDQNIIAQHIAEIGPAMAEIARAIDAKLNYAGIKLDAAEGRQINLNSPKQLMTLFELIGHPLESTDKFELALAAAEDVPFAADILSYRTMSKALGTYYEPYTELAVDGWIHPTIHTTGTDTGRLSCSDPNLQQIPKTGKKYKVKQVFTVPDGYALMQWDYKQLELRLAVFYAQERKMLQMFNEGIDLHQWTADSLGIKRDTAKTYNFSLLYGAGAKRISRIHSIPAREAYTGVEGWHKLYPAFRAAGRAYAHQASKWRNPDGSEPGRFQFIRLFNGRVRHYQEYAKHGEDAPFKDAWNAKIQGTAAAVAEIAILRVVEALPNNNNFRPIVPIHDALMAYVPLRLVRETNEIVSHIMSDWPQFNPKLEVDTSISTTSWYDMKPYNREDW